MRVQFGASAYDSNQYGLPVVKLENWYPEFKPQLGQVRLLPTPGLELVHTASEGMRGVYQADGALGGKIVFADGTSLVAYDEGGTATTLGSVKADSYRAQFASSQVETVCVSGGTAYMVTQSAVSPFQWVGPTGDIIAVAEYAQRHLYLEGGSGRLWWSEVANADDVRATSFATAESEPDNLLTLDVHAGSIYLGGSETVEVWAYTGSLATPFIPRPGGSLPFGVIGRDATAKADFGLFMVATNGLVYRLDGSQPRRVSVHDVERRIKALSKADQALVSLSAHVWDGHTFIRVNLPRAGSWVYDVATEQWHRARSLSRDTHVARDYVEAFGNVYTAGAAGLYRLDNELYTEGGENVRRVATAIVPVEDARPVIDNLVIYTSTAGDMQSAPQAMLRLARDTRTFGTEVVRDLPLPGEYAKPTRWSQLGRLRPPAAVLELAVSDPVGITLSDIQLNMTRP